MTSLNRSGRSQVMLATARARGLGPPLIRGLGLSPVSRWPRKAVAMDIAIATRRLRCLLDGTVRRPAAWYAGLALYAAGVALFSGRGLDRWWGIWAAGGYSLAFAVAASGGRRGPRRARGGQGAGALPVGVAGAVAAPLVGLAPREPITPDALVVGRSGVLLLHHGSPYLGSAALASGGWLAYNPYLPVMAVFGLPKALGPPGLVG